MIIGALRVEFYIPDNRSLKGKRRIVKSMVDRVRQRFNVSIAEVGANNDWQRIQLGITLVGNEKAYIDASLSKVLSYLESLYLAQLMSSKIEFIHM